MVGKIAHIGIAVKDIGASTTLFESLFGMPPDHSEELPDHNVRTAMFRMGDAAVELTQSLDPESPVARFIAKRGEGVHHVSFVVDDIEKELMRLKAAGFQLIDEHSRPGADGYRVAFLHPKSTNGVLVELCEKMTG
ncbi:MAG TPA: methylmalonyl-CoA epimerase [Bacteroidota bacterium]|nr:methylmalonyl-CoA epimerase [Bacteroidota bacterium]